MEGRAPSLSLLGPMSSKEPVPVSELVGGAPSDSGRSTSAHKEEGGSREVYTRDRLQNDTHGVVYEDDDKQKEGCKVHDSVVAWLTSAFHTRQSP